MIMTDFSTPYCKRNNPQPAELFRMPLRVLRLMVLVLGMICFVGSFAQQTLQSGDFGVRAEEDGYFLQSTFDFELPIGVEDALNMERYL